MSAPMVVAKPFIDWVSLGKVAGVSLVFGVGVVVLFSIAILGLSIARHHDVTADGKPAGALAENRTLGAVVAGVCFTVCAAAVLYGLYLIIPQFH